MSVVSIIDDLSTYHPKPLIIIRSASSSSNVEVTRDPDFANGSNAN